MSESSAAPVVLIVDDDVAFVWWIGEVLSDSGFQTIPAVTCLEALELARTLDLKIEFVFVNPGLAGVSAMIDSLVRMGFSPRIILIRDAGADDAPGFSYHARLERPNGLEPVSRSEWVRKLRDLLLQLKTA